LLREKGGLGEGRCQRNKRKEKVLKSLAFSCEKKDGDGDDFQKKALSVVGKKNPGVRQRTGGKTLTAARPRKREKKSCSGANISCSMKKTCRKNCEGGRETRRQLYPQFRESLLREGGKRHLKKSRRLEINEKGGHREKRTSSFRERKARQRIS